MLMQTSSVGRAFIEGFESLVLYPYDDMRAPIGGKYTEWKGEPLLGTATIGYGHTDAAKYSLKVVPGLKITTTQADEILDIDLGDCVEAVNTDVKVPITQGEFDALVSFTFNCGAGSLCKLIAHGLNRGDYDSTRSAFDLYVYSGGQRLLGLQRRRDGEQALWDSFPVAIPTEPVHHGAQVDEPSTWTLVQEMLNKLGANPRLVEDNDPGKLTLAAIAAQLRKDLV